MMAITIKETERKKDKAMLASQSQKWVDKIFNETGYVPVCIASTKDGESNIATGMSISMVSSIILLITTRIILGERKNSPTGLIEAAGYSVKTDDTYLDQIRLGMEAEAGSKITFILASNETDNMIAYVTRDNELIDSLLTSALTAMARRTDELEQELENLR